MTAQDASCRFAAVGPGRMGRGIAMAFACAGHPVALIDLRDRTESAWKTLADDVDAEIASTLSTLVDLGVLRDDQVPLVKQRIKLVPKQAAPSMLASAELVCECVPEVLAAKQETFHSLNQYCSGDAILASTTSSIPASRIAACVSQPQRFLNTHWLNPAYIMPVVEISYHPATSDGTISRSREILTSVGKRPVVCGASPGYIVPRLQALIMNEAARMVEEGVATAEDIDQATRYGLGLRFSALGVLEFIDYGGCEILKRATATMAEDIDAHRYTLPQIIDDMVREGNLGLRSGRGFYTYDETKTADYRRDALKRIVNAVRHQGMLATQANNFPV